MEFWRFDDGEYKDDKYPWIPRSYFHGKERFQNLKCCVLVQPNIELNERFEILRIIVKFANPYTVNKWF